MPFRALLVTFSTDGHLILITGVFLQAVPYVA